MPLTPIEITRDNLSAFLLMDVTPEQVAADLVASNAITLAQAQFEPGSRVLGLVDGDIPVGLLAIIDPEAPGVEVEPDEPQNALYVWRLMIAADHQGKGYGKAAMEIAFAEARRHGRTTLFLSAEEHPLSAIPFYERLGLTRTGRVVEGEVELAGPVPP